MKKYLFYVKSDGEIECLYAGTQIEMIDTNASEIKVVEANDYESGAKEYISCGDVRETMKILSNRESNVSPV